MKDKARSFHAMKSQPVGGVLVVEYVKRAQKGDRNAFIKLIENKKAQLYKTALMQLNNNADALDAVQDTILTAFERVYTLKEAEHFNTWLVRILLNKCHDIQRARKRVVAIEEFCETTDSSKYCNEFESIEMREMLNSLDEVYRTVLDLRYNQDMKVEDIARVLDIPSGTVKSRINKALKLLKSQFDYVKKEGTGK
jgi:RNA polymerase sigma-70 factor, ECF subfamily